MSKYQVLLGVAINAIVWGAITDEIPASPPALQGASSQTSLVALLQDAGAEAQQVEADEAGRLKLDDGDATLREALQMLKNDDTAQTGTPAGQTAENGDQNDDQDADQKSLFAARKTRMDGSRFSLPPIAALTTATDLIGNGTVPRGFRGDAPEPLAPLPESGDQRGQTWQWNAKYWAAANTFSHPLYFEDRMLERHGHERFPHIQSLVSGGRFLTDTFLLPYHSALHPPSECMYTLGYYRAGNCVPALKQRPPFKRKAAAAQAAALVTAGWILP